MNLFIIVDCRLAQDYREWKYLQKTSDGDPYRNVNLPTTDEESSAAATHAETTTFESPITVQVPKDTDN